MRLTTAANTFCRLGVRMLLEGIFALLTMSVTDPSYPVNTNDSLQMQFCIILQFQEKHKKSCLEFYIINS